MFLVGSTGSVGGGAMAERGLFDEAFLPLVGLAATGAVCNVFLPDR